MAPKTIKDVLVYDDTAGLMFVQRTKRQEKGEEAGVNDRKAYQSYVHEYGKNQCDWSFC